MGFQVRVPTQKIGELRVAVGVASGVRRSRVGATQGVGTARWGNVLNLRCEQLEQRRRQEAGAVGPTQQERIVGLPAQASLRIGGAAEVAVVVVADLDVTFEVLHDRDVQFGEHRVLVARNVDVLGGATEARNVTRLQCWIKALRQLGFEGLATNGERQRPGR